MKKAIVYILSILAFLALGTDLAAQLSQKAQRDLNITQAKKYIKAGNEKSAEKYLKKLDKLDSKTAKEMRVELYMTRVTQELKKNKHSSALKYMEKIRSLEINLPVKFYYFSGRSLFKTEQLEKSRTDLMKYINQAGDKGIFVSAVYT